MLDAKKSLTRGRPANRLFYRYLLSCPRYRQLPIDYPALYQIEGAGILAQLKS
jgi:hypothetical protein